MSYYFWLFLGPTETLDFLVSKRMKKRSQTSSISGKQVSTTAFAGEAVHEKYLKHFNPFNESNRDQSNTCIARRSDFFQPRSGMRSGRKQVTANTGLQGNYTNELQIRPKKQQHIYMSKQPLDVSDWQGYWLTLTYAHDQITKTREWWKMTILYQYVKLQDSSQDYLTL